MMDEFLHLRQHPRFWRTHILPIVDIDRTLRQTFDHLPQNFCALPHFFDADKITIVTVSGTADHNIEIILLVLEVWMRTPQVMLYTASSQIRPGERIRNCAIPRDNAD